MKQRETAFPCFMAVFIMVAGIATLNLLFPHSFRLFAIDYISWLPIGAVFAWSLLVLLALCGCRVWLAQVSFQRFARVAGFVFLFTILLSIPVWRTSQPTLHGDGHGGYKANAGHANLRERLPEILALYSRVDFHSPTCDLHDRHYELDQAAIFQSLLFGVLAVIAAFLFFRTHERDAAVFLGAFLLVATAPPLGGAYGHFDGYAESVFFQLLWWGAICHAALRGFTVRSVMLIALALALALWVHPLHLVLVAYALYFLVYSKIIAPNVRSYRIRAAMAFGFAAFLALAALFREHNAFVTPQTKMDLSLYLTPYVWRFLHLKLSAFLLTALPATALFCAVVFSSRTPVFASDDARISTCAVAFVNAFLLLFTLGMDLGVADEFLYGVLGTIALGASLTLFCLNPLPDRRALVYFALLSIFLQVPRVIVNAGDLAWDRFRSHFPKDQCLHNIRLSPYVHLAFSTPLDRPADRQRRLVAFEDGFRTPIAHWQRYALNNFLFFTAWSYEFGEREQGRRALEQLLVANPDAVPDLWMTGTGYTYRYSNTAFRLARKDSGEILQTLARGHASEDTKSVYRQLLVTLDRIEKEPETIQVGSPEDAGR